MTAAHVHGREGCLDLLERLSEYLDGDLDPSVRAAIEGHFSDCEPCVAFLRSLRNTVAHVGELPRPSLPEDLRRACLETYERRCREG